MNVLNELFANQDTAYAKFQARLIPSLDMSKIIGVRIPVLRKISKKLTTKEAEKFLNSLPHFYLEENLLHAFLIENITDFNVAVKYTEIFLPYIDNWVVCDYFSPKIFQKNKSKLLPYVSNFLQNDYLYCKRYALVLLMKYFTNQNCPLIDEIAKINSNEYYLNTAVAWYFTTAVTKGNSVAIEYVFSDKINKNIQKLIKSKVLQSKAVSAEIKERIKKI